MTMNIPIIIPAYEPDERLIELLKKLQDNDLGPVVIVDDGSGEKYQHIFSQAHDMHHCHVLKHARNLGKGRALKNAFNYLLTKEDIGGCLTVDSDGQHGISDIKNCIKMFEENPHKLILGCRNFDLPNVPAKSKFGNKLTHNICKWLCGINLSDTQTGLRAIPKDFMAYLLNTPGERFEFETNMLLESRNLVEIKEVPIETIYDSKDEHTTHFDPIGDSIKIYRIFGKEFLKFVVSSLSSSILDLILFSAFCGIFRTLMPLWYITAATVLARIISAIYNYLINYKFVFQSNAKHSISNVKYFLLAIIQMSLSAFLVTVCTKLLTTFSEVGIKIIIDTLLFFFSYKIQQKYIFQKRTHKKTN